MSLIKVLSIFLPLLATVSCLDPMKFPLTIGGFYSFTTIEAFTFDSSGGLVIAGFSNDVYIMTYFYLYVVYLPFGATTYKWANSYNWNGYSLTSMQVDPTDSTVFILEGTSSGYLYALSMTNGSFISGNNLYNEKQIDLNYGVNATWIDGLVYTFFYNSFICTSYNY